ncbi:non-homologous end-joining DNA ligase [Phytohabitans sp. ZYX-F-186]|uniref:DNA ligase (ATP) n=1 Tax=Phytohabitans maris TaxID=3071409 RepID=A0ABU0ZDD6_9ACTN|nr:non-homologous end-joining DNA ligase [Phytohabitans sp. ZYX-F-186]MDQ7905073.1 non-homologous end-joining DNA ligase [Phytohabitans sp. ZYX-F-186]
MEVGSLPLLRPMLATLGELPAGGGWGYEFKWDGVRAIVYVERGEVRVLSRNDRDVAASYPELRALPRLLPAGPVVLDGEIVTLDGAGAPSFARLQQRMHVREPTPALLKRVPVHLYAFDVLHLGGRSTVKRPYRERRELLDGLGLRDDPVRTPPCWADDRGGDLMAAAAEQGLEGVVAKRLDSPYQPGVRSRLWIKTPRNATREVIVCGWTPGSGRRSGIIGALLLGAYDEAGRLVYIGKVGTGFTNRMLVELGERLGPLRRADPPFDGPVPRPDAREATWVQPRLVGDVEYRTVSPDRRLRHPSWRGLRADKQPREVAAAAPS